MCIRLRPVMYGHGQKAESELRCVFRFGPAPEKRNRYTTFDQPIIAALTALLSPSLYYSDERMTERVRAVGALDQHTHAHTPNFTSKPTVNPPNYAQMSVRKRGTWCVRYIWFYTPLYKPPMDGRVRPARSPECVFWN